jgi:hypothetical protein
VERSPLEEFSLPRAPEGPTGWASWPPAARWAVGCGSGCVVLVLLQALVMWAAFAVLFTVQPPEGLAARIEAPASVTVGEPFPLAVVVENQGTEPFRVQNLAARAATLQLFSLESPEPPATTPMRLLGSATWTYNQSVQPGETWRVTFQATALSAGAHAGTIEVQANMAPRPVSFTVEAAEAGGGE